MEIYFDKINIKNEFGLYVANSKGLFDLPKIKTPPQVNWQHIPGVQERDDIRVYDVRKIELQMFFLGGGPEMFQNTITQFAMLLDKPGLRLMTIDTENLLFPGSGGDEKIPLVWMIRRDGNVAINKTFNLEKMVGTFNMSLIEPSPQKIVYWVSYQSQVTITIDTEFPVDIYWNDEGKNVSYNVKSGVTKKNYFQMDSSYFVIVGRLDKIRSLNVQGAILVWDRL